MPHVNYIKVKCKIINKKSEKLERKNKAKKCCHFEKIKSFYVKKALI